MLAIANQKGGVGKTTTAVNLATSLAENGQRVLVIDFDPQGNASTGFGIESAARTTTAYDVIVGEARLREAIIATEVERVELVPSTVDLSGAEVQLLQHKRRAYVLRDALADLDDTYDTILIDCPPSLGTLTVNALVAADAVLVPLQCEFFALEGLSLLVRTIERVRAGFNRGLHIYGILLTMYDKRNNLSEQVAADVRGFLGSRVFETVIPRNVRVSEAPSHGKPVLLYDRTSMGAVAYTALAAEILKREQASPVVRASR